MKLRFLSVCLLTWGAAAAFAAPPPATRPAVTCDPNDPGKTRTIVSREEREPLGLTPRTWTGVVQPEVYATLEKVNRTVEKLKNTRSMEATQTLFAMQLRGEGTVYVQVHLKHETKGEPRSEENMAAIRALQRRVLGNLTAAEFHRPFLLETFPGLTGFATKEGLDKLARNPDVTGVCLDDRPFPNERPRNVYKDDLPRAGASDGSTTKPGVAEMKVDPDVYRALDLVERVNVSVTLRGDSIPKPTDVPSEMWARDRLAEEAAKRLQDKVLSAVNADEFWDWVRFPGDASLGGFVNKRGLQKLLKHPDVMRIELVGLMRIPDQNQRPR